MSNLHSFTPFYGGIADIKFYGYTAKGQSGLVENLDIISNPRVLKLPPLPADEVNTGSRKPFAFFDNFVTCEDGLIFDVDSATTYTQTTGNDLVNAFAINSNYLWIDDAGNISRITQANAQAGNFAGNVTEDFASLTTSATRAYPVLLSSQITNSGVYIGNKNLITLMNSTSWTNSTAVTLDGDYNIVGLTETNQMIIAYTREGTVFYLQVSDTNGGLAIVDSFNFNEGIYAVYNNGVYDYILTSGNKGSQIPISTNPSLYILSGKQKKLVKQERENDDSTEGSDFRFNVSVGNDYNMGHYNDMLFIPADKGFYLYGKAYDGFPSGVSHYLTKDYLENAMGLVHCVNVHQGKLYRGYTTSGSTYRVNSIDLDDLVGASTPPDFATGGTYVTYEFDGGEYTNPKKANELWIGAKMGTNTTIQVSYKLDDDAAYTSVGTIDDTYDDKTTFKINRQFQKIKFKLVLTNSGTKTPEIYDVSLLYTVDKRTGQ